MSMYSMVTAINLSRQSPVWHSRERRQSLHEDQPHLTKFHERVIAELKKKTASGKHNFSPRRCPECQNHLLQLEIDDVPLEYCGSCHGWWFDTAELMHFTELFEDLPDGDLADRESSLACPVCKRAMQEQPLSLNSNLLVHVCPDQHGVFLKDGEFERALELSDRVDGLAGHLNDQHLAVWHELQARLSKGDFSRSDVKCPECGKNHVVVVVDEIPIDYCTRCQSCWFDTQELKHFTCQSRDIPGDYLTSLETQWSCPKCDLNLKLYQFRPKSNVTVRACPAGHGVYLQKDQLPRVLQASE